MRAAFAIQGIGYLILGIIVYVAVQHASSPADTETARTTPMNNETLIVRSPAFNDGQPIPSKYTCDGENMSPPLAIEQIPASTTSMVLVVDDPDAPSGTWDHWVVFNIPRSVTRIGEGEVPEGSVQGRSSWDTSAYGGPCPPDGEHRYIFTVYALSTSLRLGEEATKADVLDAMQGHILASGELQGTYTKQ